MIVPATAEQTGSIPTENLTTNASVAFPPASAGLESGNSTNPAGEDENTGEALPALIVFLPEESLSDSSPILVNLSSNSLMWGDRYGVFLDVLPGDGNSLAIHFEQETYSANLYEELPITVGVVDETSADLSEIEITLSGDGAEFIRGGSGIQHPDTTGHLVLLFLNPPSSLDLHGSPGTYTLKATASKRIGTSGTSELRDISSATATITVNEGFSVMTMQGIVTLLLAGLILLIVFVLLWTRPILKIIPKKTMAPCDGESTIDIKVEFANVFGIPRRQKVQEEIELRSTAGAIEDAVVHPFSAAAHAPLRTSRECGPVTVTAFWRNKEVSAVVEFACDDPTLVVESTPTEIPADGKSTAEVTVKTINAKGDAITFLNERTVALSTTMGTIPGKVTIPARALQGAVSLTAPHETGVARIHAEGEGMEGEGTIRFIEPFKNYCMNCGYLKRENEQVCPECGRLPVSGVDTKLCPACGQVLPETAEFCNRCGRKQ
ncbi:MAG: zinc ribbon domain-containing protein [Methanomicrobiaceae archaeon]|nr:zinc ribbon domain-containing protein [Methanomicrobiaceae archaeon]